MAKDLFHNAVRRALEKDGWTITDDPYTIKFDDDFVDYDIDLGAEKLISATKGTEKIAIEIKSFLKSSESYEFHSALGQYFTYKEALKFYSPERTLYLAVPSKLEKGILKSNFIKRIISLAGMKFIIFDPNKEEILKWIN